MTATSRAKEKTCGQHLFVSRGDFGQRRNMSPWNNQYVHRSDRRNIVKCDGMLVLGHKRGRNLAPYNFAEDAIIHLRSPVPLPNPESQSYQPSCPSSLRLKQSAALSSPVLSDR